MSPSTLGTLPATSTCLHTGKFLQSQQGACVQANRVQVYLVYLPQKGNLTIIIQPYLDP